jgi:hypothetical protein
MSGRIEMYDSEKEETSKWSKNEAFKVRSAGVDIGNDSQGGGGGTNDYRDLKNLPLINGRTLIGNKDSEEDLGIVDSEPLTYIQLKSLADKLN